MSSLHFTMAVLLLAFGAISPTLKASGTAPGNCTRRLNVIPGYLPHVSSCPGSRVQADDTLKDASGISYIYIKPLSLLSQFLFNLISLVSQIRVETTN